MSTSPNFATRLVRGVIFFVAMSLSLALLGSVVWIVCTLAGIVIQWAFGLFDLVPYWQDNWSAFWRGLFAIAVLRLVMTGVYAVMSLLQTTARIVTGNRK